MLLRISAQRSMCDGMGVSSSPRAFADIPEAKPLVERLFSYLDQDASGKLDYAELKLAHDRIVDFAELRASTSAQQHTPRGDNAGDDGLSFDTMFYGDRSLNIFKSMHHEVGREEFWLFCETVFQISGRRQFFAAATEWEKALRGGCPVARGKALPKTTATRGCPFAGRPAPERKLHSPRAVLPRPSADDAAVAFLEKQAATAMAELPGSEDILEAVMSRAKDMEARLERLMEKRTSSSPEAPAVVDDEAMLEDQQAAAVAIQARWKGKKARKEAQQKRHQRQKEEHTTGVDELWELLTSGAAGGALARASGGLGLNTHLDLEVLLVLHDAAVEFGLVEAIHLHARHNKRKLSQVTYADYKTGKGRYEQVGHAAKKTDEAMVCTSLQIAKLAHALAEDTSLSLEKCREIVESISPHAKSPVRGDWMALSLDLGVFRALTRALAGLAGVPVDLLIGQLLFARTNRFECSHHHLEMMFERKKKNRRYDDTGEVIEDPLTLSEFIKLCREAGLLDPTGRHGMREPELQLLFLDTLRKLPDLMKERAETIPGLAKHGKAAGHVHIQSGGTGGGDGFIGRTEVSILFHQLWEKHGKDAGFKSPLQILHRLLDEKGEELAHHHHHSSSQQVPEVVVASPPSPTRPAAPATEACSSEPGSGALLSSSNPEEGDLTVDALPTASSSSRKPSNAGSRDGPTRSANGSGVRSSSGGPSKAHKTEGKSGHPAATRHAPQSGRGGSKEAARRSSQKAATCAQARSLSP